MYAYYYQVLLSISAPTLASGLQTNPSNTAYDGYPCSTSCAFFWAWTTEYRRKLVRRPRATHHLSGSSTTSTLRHVMIPCIFPYMLGLNSPALVLPTPSPRDCFACPASQRIA